MVMDNQK